MSGSWEGTSHLFWDLSSPPSSLEASILRSGKNPGPRVLKFVAPVPTPKP